MLLKFSIFILYLSIVIFYYLINQRHFLILKFDDYLIHFYLFKIIYYF
jgi:hypothetical protein